MNTWAIGDIHGQTGHLKALLEQIPIKADDRIVFLGDLIDRGPDTPGVLRLIRQRRESQEVILLRGNHECHSRHSLEVCQSRRRAFQGASVGMAFLGTDIDPES